MISSLKGSFFSREDLQGKKKRSNEEVSEAGRGSEVQSRRRRRRSNKCSKNLDDVISKFN